MSELSGIYACGGRASAIDVGLQLLLGIHGTLKVLCLRKMAKYKLAFTRGGTKASLEAYVTTSF